MYTASALHHQNNAKEAAYIIQDKDLSRRIDSTSEGNAGLLTTAIRRNESTMGFSVLNTSGYLNVRPFSPTSVSSPASNKVRSRSKPHWWMTNKEFRLKG